MSTVLERFPTAAAEDLPAVARFLLQHAAPGVELKTVGGGEGGWCPALP